MSQSSFRRDYLTKPIFRLAQHALPRLSDTEREAIEAGDVWWDAELFTGNPDWRKLLAFAPAKLSVEEQQFLSGPVEELCHMLDDWKINWQWHDLPPEVWEFLKSRKFFAMIIPKHYGGLGFSAYAHSEVIRKLSSCSICAAVTAMVPNSLGPGELLLQFGTQAQRDYWLPRLARGEEIPCFGLTSPEAGSDAAAMIDSGVVCRGTFEGRETIGIRLNWHKRYITLGPIATVLGLAFKLSDPDHLIGSRDDIGITLALVPTNLPGVSIGRRHLPAMQVFQNGPNWGHDVFIPIDNVIGGVDQVGKGWKMLMSALAAGRGISLPSLSAAGAAFSANVTGAYARIREQFHVPIAQFEAIQERLGRIAATAYLLDAARRMTCAALDDGHHPAVVTAIMKAQATERMRVAVNDAMDVHGGKAIIEGPLNYLGSLYRGVPIGITVEGANIVTRALIQFGQGAIRCHPYLLKEMQALEDTDRERGLDTFDKVFWSHVGHSLANTMRAWGRCRRGDKILPAAQPLCRGVCARRRSGALDAGRRFEAQRDDLGAVRRHSFGALSVERGAQALERRGPPAGRCPAAAILHGGELRHHRGALRRDHRQLPGAAGGLAAALLDPAARPAPPRPIRPRHRQMRKSHHHAERGARSPHCRSVPSGRDPNRKRRCAA
jgi:acyl-CoA dehydrogenase